MVEINRTYIRVKVTPNSSKNEVVGEMADGTVKIRIHAKPKHGEANLELLKFLSVVYDLPRENIKIISGKTDSIKLIKLSYE